MADSTDMGVYGSVSSFYGPGVLIGWATMALSTFSEESLSANFIATITMPLVAAGHVVYQAYAFARIDLSHCSAEWDAVHRPALVALVQTGYALNVTMLVLCAVFALRDDRLGKPTLVMAGIAFLDEFAFGTVKKMIALRAKWLIPCGICRDPILSARLCPEITSLYPSFKIFVLASLISSATVGALLFNPYTFYLWDVHGKFPFHWLLDAKVGFACAIGAFNVRNQPSIPQTQCRLSDLDQAVAAFAGASILAGSAWKSIREFFHKKKTDRPPQHGDEEGIELQILLPQRDLSQGMSRSYGTEISDI